MSSRKFEKTPKAQRKKTKEEEGEEAVKAQEKERNGVGGEGKVKEIR